MKQQLTAERTLPVDAQRATLVGRAFLPAVEGPAVVTVRDGQIVFQRGYYDKLTFLRIHGLPIE